MDVGLFYLGALVVVNIATVAFSYGKLNQQVKDLCRRMGRVEDTINGKVAKKGKK